MSSSGTDGTGQPAGRTGPHHHPRRRVLVRGVLALLALMVVYVGVTFVQVWWTSRQDGADSAGAADAIIVLGAAQYDGRPSPVFQQRLDHAAELWEADMAPVVIVTGGKQEGDRVTQGRAGYDYLRSKGLPDDALRVEVDGTNTYEEISASARILRNESLGDEVLLVTDPFHAMRVKGIAEEVDLDARVSPTDRGASLNELARETVGVSLGRVIGYRRLSNLL